MGANTLPLGRKQRKAFVKEVMLGPQSGRIFSEFFEHVGPSKIQYKSVTDQGDEAIFLHAIPQPKVWLKLGSWAAIGASQRRSHR